MKSKSEKKVQRTFLSNLDFSHSWNRNGGVESFFFWRRFFFSIAPRTWWWWQCWRLGLMATAAQSGHVRVLYGNEAQLCGKLEVSTFLRPVPRCRCRHGRRRAECCRAVVARSRRDPRNLDSMSPGPREKSQFFPKRNRNFSSDLLERLLCGFLFPFPFSFFFNVYSIYVYRESFKWHCVCVISVGITRVLGIVNRLALTLCRVKD